jgi:hypothetical protein
MLIESMSLPGSNAGGGRDGSGNSAANFDTRAKSRSETSY